MSSADGGSQAVHLEQLTKGDRYAVDPSAIEQQLQELWRQAQTEGGAKDRKPLTRACLWNVALHAESREGEEGSAGLPPIRDAIDLLPQFMASRALILETKTHRETGAEIESWISANCALAPDGSKVVCSEEVTVASYGAGEKHLVGLLHALLVPDVPTAVVYAGVPPKRGPMASDLIEVAERIVTRADRSSMDAPLNRLRQVSRRPPLGIIDLGWFAQASLRSLVAELFEPPATDDDWREITDIEISASQDVAPSAKLVLGWIASCLGGTTASQDGDNTWKVPAGGSRRLQCKLQIVESESPTGVERVELRGKERTWFVQRADARHWQIAPGRGSARQVVVEGTTEAALLADALRSRGEDAAFNKALKIASEMK